MGENQEQVKYCVCVFGCRNYNNYEVVSEYLDYVLQHLTIHGKICIVSGCASGVDTLAIRYANERGFEILKFPAEWNKYGRCAGLRRNKLMCVNSAYFIGFWDGKSPGTKNMIECVKKAQKPLEIKKIDT